MFAVYSNGNDCKKAWQNNQNSSSIFMKMRGSNFIQPFQAIHAGVINKIPIKPAATSYQSTLFYHCLYLK